jgi:hypothetical protein
MSIPLISSRFMLLEVQDAKNINGNFDFFVDFEMKGQCHKYIFSSFCIEVLYLMFTSISKIRFQESTPVALLNYECKSVFFPKLRFFADFLYLLSSPK